jgi:uncharacterized phage infection (PIP) family protein YhgE
LTNSSSLDWDDSHSEILELESIPSNPNESIVAAQQPNTSSDFGVEATTPNWPIVASQKMKVPKIVQSIKIDSTGEILDVTAELDLLIRSLEQATPQPPKIVNPLSLAALPEHNQARERRQQESRSISETLAAIAATEIATNNQLYQELNNIHQQLVTARAELQTLHHRNQSQVDAVDANATQVHRLKVRTQQLAHYTKERVGKIQELIVTADGIRADIVTALEQFGDRRQIRSLLTELEASRHALILAHDRLSTGQEAFYESLHAIQERVTAQSNDSIQQLGQYQQLIQNLSQTISTDRLQIAGMSVDLSLKCSQVQDLSVQITDMHAQITEKSQVLHSRVAEIERGFTKLTESMQLENERFYELTAQTIDRTEAIQSEFTNIAKEFSLDREAIATLQSELASVREHIERTSEQQLDYFDLQFYEMMADWSELSDNRKEQGGDRRKILTWLWILSAAIGFAIVVLIYILMHLK